MSHTRESQDRDRDPHVHPAADVDAPPPPASPCIMVIFGASGDLTRRKLVPALFNLRRSGLLPEEFAVLGIARQPFSDDELRERVDDDIASCDEPADPQCQAWLLQRVYYMAGDVNQREMYDSLKVRLEELDAKHRTQGNVLYYLATAPKLFPVIVEHLGAAGLGVEGQGQWRRIVVEKPFGRDLDSARELNRKLAAVFDENQIYRIDHYLGKETVQNILAFRFGLLRRVRRLARHGAEPPVPARVAHGDGAPHFVCSRRGAR